MKKKGLADLAVINAETMRGYYAHQPSILREWVSLLSGAAESGPLFSSQEAIGNILGVMQMRQITTSGLESKGEGGKRRSQGSSRKKREGQVCSFRADRLGDGFFRIPFPQDEHEGSCFCHQIQLSNDVQAPPSSLQEERKELLGSGGQREEQSERRARLLLWGNRKEARLQEEGSCESKEVWPPSVLRVAGPVGAFLILCPGLLGLLPEDC